MSFSYKLKEKYIQELPAIGHPDNMVRVQTLTQKDDAELYELLQNMDDIIGFPIVCNTSLNLRAEPLCESPEDAIRLFLASSGIDFLWLDNIIVGRREIWKDLSLEDTRVQLHEHALATVIPTTQHLLLTLHGNTYEVPSVLIELVKEIIENGHFTLTPNWCALIEPEVATVISNWLANDILKVVKTAGR